jgi:hypothetical protein
MLREPCEKDEGIGVELASNRGLCRTNAAIPPAGGVLWRIRNLQCEARLPPFWNSMCHALVKAKQTYDK